MSYNLTAVENATGFAETLSGWNTVSNGVLVDVLFAGMLFVCFAAMVTSTGNARVSALMSSLLVFVVSAVLAFLEIVSMGTVKIWFAVLILVAGWYMFTRE